MVIDFLFDINTFEVWVRLISADLIKQVENPGMTPSPLSGSPGRLWKVRRFLLPVDLHRVVARCLVGVRFACPHQRHPCN
jgi:hypothetical protein